MKVRRILHASDFSKASRPAFDLALEMARAFKAELLLGHAYQAITPIGAGDAYVAGRVVEQMWTAARTSAGRDLARLAQRAKAARVRASVALAEGPAAETIVRLARRRRADLIVLGTHGRTGLRRLLIGSVAERVVRTATVPVVTVGARR